MTDGLLQPRLADLELTWQQQGAPIARHLARGATSDELDGVEGTLGHRLPPEVRALWSWHDGVQLPEERVPWVRTVGPGFWEFLSSQDALALRDWHRSRWSGDPDAGDDFEWQGQWRSAWLPLFQMDAYVLFVDCRQVNPVGTAPIRRHDKMPDDVFTPRAGSLWHLIDGWVFVLQQRHRYWDASEGGWAQDDATLPMVVHDLC